MCVTDQTGVVRAAIVEWPCSRSDSVQTAAKVGLDAQSHWDAVPWRTVLKIWALSSSEAIGTTAM